MSISDGKPMLETRDLTLKYGHSQILHGISMQARAGEVTCVMGTNGVGKTSLLKAISGRSRRRRRMCWRRKAWGMCRRAATSFR